MLIAKAWSKAEAEKQRQHTCHSLRLKERRPHKLRTQLGNHRNVYRIKTSIRSTLHNDSGGGRVGWIPSLQSWGKAGPRCQWVKPGNKKPVSTDSAQYCNVKTLLLLHRLTWPARLHTAHEAKPATPSFPQLEGKWIRRARRILKTNCDWEAAATASLH